MAFQPLYGVVSDNQGGHGHSLVLRGRVDNVSFWLNSFFGEVMKVNARLIEGKSRVARPDLRKVKKAQRAEVLGQYKLDVEQEDKVIIDIDVPANKKFEVRLNGVVLSYERLKLLEEQQLKRLDMHLETLKQLQKDDRRVLELAKVVMQ